MQRKQSQRNSSLSDTWPWNFQAGGSWRCCVISSLEDYISMKLKAAMCTLKYRNVWNVSNPPLKQKEPVRAAPFKPEHFNDLWWISEALQHLFKFANGCSSTLGLFSCDSQLYVKVTWVTYCRLNNGHDSLLGGNSIIFWHICDCRRTVMSLLTPPLTATYIFSWVLTFTHELLI